MKGISKMTNTHEIVVAGVKPSSWPNTQRGPTAFEWSALSASQQLFIKLMRCLEGAETRETIEGLGLPSNYTGKNMKIENLIETDTQWVATLHALLEAIEYEKHKSNADSFITALFSYSFSLNYVNGATDPISQLEEDHGP